MGEEKTLKMVPRESEQKTGQDKLSYEQLEQTANQLAQVNMQLRQQLEKVNYGNFHQRMAYLFEVIKNPLVFNEEFISKCAKEIEFALTIPEEEVTQE